MTSMPRSISMFWMSITSRSLPGMAQDEKITRSPALRSIAGCSPRAMRAIEARGSPWLPVHSSTTLSRGSVLKASWSRNGVIPSIMPSSRAMPVMRCMARPDITTCRPARCAARATEITRPTLEAKVVTATRCGAAAIRLASVSATSVSLGLTPSLSALVKSQIERQRSALLRPDRREAHRHRSAAPPTGRRIEFPVAGVQHPADRRRDQQRIALGNRVRDVDRLDRERPERERLARPHGGDADIVDDVVGGALGRQHRRGEGGGEYRPVEARPEVEHGAVMILVAVRQDQREHIVRMLLEEGGIGHDQFDARLVSGRRR